MGGPFAPRSRTPRATHAPFPGGFFFGRSARERGGLSLLPVRRARQAEARGRARSINQVCVPVAAGPDASSSGRA